VRLVKAILRFLGRYYSVFLLLAAYEAMSRLALVSPRLFPSLVVIAEQLWKYTANGDLIYQASISLNRALLGFALALAVGVLLGTAMARSRPVEALIEPLFIFSYPIPKIALYPVFIFVFGLGTESKVALVFLECLYPIVIHVHAGMRSADRVLVWAARNMGANPRQIFLRVLVPASLPIVFTGLRIALPVSLIITLVTEIIGESRGLGFFVTFATSSFQYARALAAFFVIAVLGFLLDRALVFARNRIVFWQGSGATVRGVD
jgi:NitT/TauT family transport system permease protein